MRDDVVETLRAIIARERSQGCPMAQDWLIEPALQRWRSFDRRNTRSKDHSFAHRARDLKKHWMSLCPNFSYDEACLAHLAESFAEVLVGECDQKHESDRE